MYTPLTTLFSIVVVATAAAVPVHRGADDCSSTVRTPTATAVLSTTATATALSCATANRKFVLQANSTVPAIRGMYVQIVNAGTGSMDDQIAFTPSVASASNLSINAAGQLYTPDISPTDPYYADLHSLSQPSRLFFNTVEFVMELGYFAATCQVTSSGTLSCGTCNSPGQFTCTAQPVSTFQYCASTGTTVAGVYLDSTVQASCSPLTFNVACL